ncbi:MAG TPA: ribosome silencing factor [Methylococcaceae bacterium]|nr:ribosome silencing factor [Methylococcaceae bacterium]
MPTQEVLDIVLAALDDGKARDVKVLDVRGKTSVTDYMVVASGTSDRHVRAVADQVAEKSKERGAPPLGTEGGPAADWVLVDLGDVVVHVMKPQAREFYQLEKLWGADSVPSSS